MKIQELIKAGLQVAPGNRPPGVPLAKNKARRAHINHDFELLDGTNPRRPYSQQVIMRAMAELFRRIERQAAYYGGEIDQKTGEIDISKHRYYDAQVAPDE